MRSVLLQILSCSSTEFDASSPFRSEELRCSDATIGCGIKERVDNVVALHLNFSVSKERLGLYLIDNRLMYLAEILDWCIPSLGPSILRILAVEFVF